MMYNENISSTNVPSNIGYEIGYKKPPIDTRFKPGQCGNPKGRPKKKSGDIVSLLLRELQQHIFIEENGKKIKVTKREVLVKQILKKAIMGDNKCLEFVLQVEKMRTGFSVEAETSPELPARTVSPAWKQFLRANKAAKSMS